MKNWRYDLSSNTNKSYINIEDQRVSGLLKSNSTDSSVVFFSIAPIAINNVNPEYKGNFDKITTEDNFSFSWLSDFHYSWNECSTNRIRDFKFTAQIPPDNEMSKNYGYVLGIYDNRESFNDSVPFIFVPTGSKSDDSKVTYLNPFCSNFLMIDLTEYNINAVIRVNNLNNIIDEHNNLVIGPNMYHNQVATSNEPKNLAITDEMIDNARNSEIELQDISLTPTKSSNVINIYNPEEWYHMGDFTIRLLGRDVPEVEAGTNIDNVNLLAINTPNDANNREVSYINIDKILKLLVSVEGEHQSLTVNGNRFYDNYVVVVDDNNYLDSLRFNCTNSKKRLIIDNRSGNYCNNFTLRINSSSSNSASVLVPNNSQLIVNYNPNGSYGKFDATVVHSDKFEAYAVSSTHGESTGSGLNKFIWPGSYSLGSLESLCNYIEDTPKVNSQGNLSTNEFKLFRAFAYGTSNFILEVISLHDENGTVRQVLRRDYQHSGDGSSGEDHDDLYRWNDVSDLYYFREYCTDTTSIRYNADWRLVNNQVYSPNLSTDKFITESWSVSDSRRVPGDSYIKYGGSTPYTSLTGLSYGSGDHYGYLHKLPIGSSTDNNKVLLDFTSENDDGKVILEGTCAPTNKSTVNSLTTKYLKMDPDSADVSVFTAKANLNLEFKTLVSIPDTTQVSGSIPKLSGDLTIDGMLIQRLVNRSYLVQNFFDFTYSRIWIRKGQLGGQYGWEGWKLISGTYDLTVNWSVNP